MQATLSTEVVERLDYEMCKVAARAERLFGVDLYSGALLPYIEEDESKFQLWYLDSLFVGLEAAKKGDNMLAFRCMLQVRNYGGKLGWETPQLDGADIALRNHLERHVIRKLESLNSEGQ